MKRLFALIALSSFLLADTQGACPKPTPPCCRKPDPCPFPEADRCVRGYVTLDILWWKPYVGSTQYAISGINDGGTNVPNYTSVSKGYTFEPDYTFRPGYKIGVGADVGHDDWSLYGQYTWLQGGTEKNSFSTKPGQGAITAFPAVDPLGNIDTMSVASGSAKWRQTFNIFDLMLGRTFFASRYVSLKPSVGLKTAWIREKLNFNFTTTEAQVSEDQVTSLQQIRNQTMWGIGTRFGLDGIWYFSKRWGIYGNLDATALWSDFHSRAKTNTSSAYTPDLQIGTNNLNTKSSIREVIGVFETSLGLTYKIWIEDRQYRFQAWVGWEEQLWMNFNHFVENGKSGNLSLQGVTLRAALIF